MRAAIVGLVAGVGILQNSASLPGTGIALTLVLLSALLFCFLSLGTQSFLRPTQSHRLHKWFHFGLFKSTLLLLCGLAFGFGYAALRAEHSLAQALPSALEGQDITVVGTIDSLPLQFEHGIRFNFRVEKVVAPADAVIPDRLALSWYGERELISGTGPVVEPGERWQLQLRLRRPHGNANPQGFDYEAWLLEQGLRATGSVRTSNHDNGLNRRITAFVPSIGNLIEKWRWQLRNRILSALPEQRYANVIVALVVGDQRGISQSDWSIFNSTGIGHLISISGLHITMVAGLVAAGLMALWRVSFFTRAQLPLLLPAQKLAALAGVLSAFLYVLLSGFGVPAQRTLYMLTVVALAMWTGKIASVSHVLCLALAMVLLIDPWAVLWPGFWLSFGAVAIILYAATGRASHRKFGSASRGWRAATAGALREACHTQYVVTVGLVPLTLLLFSQVSLVGPLANAIAIPLISFVVTPLSLLGSMLPMPIGGWLLGAAHESIAGLALVLAWLSSWPGAVWFAPVPTPLMFGLALAGTLWMLAPPGWPLRAAGLLLWLPLLLQQPARPEHGFWLTAFDVGQGMALLVETNGHRLLYDTGPAYTSEADGANRVILPYLRSRGIGQLDTLVVSHRDADHAGGAMSILSGLRLERVLSSLEPTHAVLKKFNNHHRCAAGQRWVWDGVVFEMLHPTDASYGHDSSSNARSCTLKISYGGLSVLLPGDIEAAQEADLLARHATRLQSTVLLAPHHGSGTSSTAAFLHAVNPKLAIFQVGYRNRYRHPKPEVYQRYADAGILRLRTDHAGAIELRVTDSLHVSEFRKAHARYWFGQ